VSKLLPKVKISYLYHATYINNVASIAQEGLTPNIDRDSTFGDGYPIHGRLYVSDYEGAEWYAKQLVEIFDRDTDEVVLLRFPQERRSNKDRSLWQPWRPLHNTIH